MVMNTTMWPLPYPRLTATPLAPAPLSCNLHRNTHPSCGPALLRSPHDSPRHHAPQPPCPNTHQLPTTFLTPHTSPHTHHPDAPLLSQATDRRSHCEALCLSLLMAHLTPTTAPCTPPSPTPSLNATPLSPSPNQQALALNDVAPVLSQNHLSLLQELGVTHSPHGPPQTHHPTSPHPPLPHPPTNRRWHSTTSHPSCRCLIATCHSFKSWASHRLPTAAPVPRGRRWRTF